MTVEQYGVLKGRPIGRRFGRGEKPHYQLHLFAGEEDFRVAINLGSDNLPTDLLYLLDDRFHHPLTTQLTDLAPGFTPLDRRPGGAALDYIRGNLFDPGRMRALPANRPGPDNDMNERIDRAIGRVMADESAWIYTFGHRWGPERQRDNFFGFYPGNGLHNVHMNQGNNDRHRDEDGTWQDGALLLHFPAAGRWVAMFLAFQAQAWHTDDRTGHRLGRAIAPTPTAQPGVTPPVPPTPTTETPPAPPLDGHVRIVAALVNGRDTPETETVTLLNTSPDPVDLRGWALLDRFKSRHELRGSLAAGATLTVTLPPTVQLGNDGGIITLVDADGLKVHGVAYTAWQAAREGWTIVF